MPLSQAEFDAIIADSSKRIVGDVVWVAASGHLDAKWFRVPVLSDASDDLVMEGYFRPSRSKLGISLIAADQRIAGIDYGSNIRHRNVTGVRIDGPHLQLWSEAAGAAEASAIPQDAPSWNRPVEVWSWLCEILGIVHRGEMLSPDEEV